MIQNDNNQYEIVSFPFAQVYQSLISVSNNNIPNSCYINSSESGYKINKTGDNKLLDLLFLWTRAESVINEFQKCLEFKEVDIDKILNEVDEYSNLILEATNSCGNVFVMSWIKPLYHFGYGMSDNKFNFGISNIINKMNLRLSENLSKSANIFIIDFQKFLYKCKNIYNHKMWYTTKTLYSLELFKKVKEDIYSSINGLFGKSRRLIVVDLDNTLWGGILGDVGWEGIKIGGHDYIGEAFADFQKALKSLTNRGILLAICSKNYEKNALEAINKHPEMILKEEDFATWRINWNDKAQNIIDIAKDVNLGLSSIVFIDDNPAERNRVAEALPEVYVPEWPDEPIYYKEALLSLDCFNAPSVSKEDRKRAKMFVQERKRRELSKTLSHEEWLKSIEMEIEIEKLNSANQTRTAQLLNKTNQFNLTTRRMSEKEFVDWANQPQNCMLTFRVKDKFGDSGLTGVISYTIEDKKMKVVDFVMSCRVMGRDIEKLMLGQIIKIAQELKLEKVELTYRKTDRNQPILDFLNKSGLQKNNDTYIWKCNEDYKIPDYFNVKVL